MAGPLPTYEHVLAAHDRIGSWIHRTPVVTSRTLDTWTGAQLFFKCENLQRCGAFKFRGASNAVLLLDEDAAQRGVATHSSGNHAQALALAAKLRGIGASIVMPNTAPRVKRAAVEQYGATVIDCAPTMDARETAFRKVLDATGASPVPPYDDARIIAGQGTAALELLEEVPDLDVILVPIGGGGLTAGTALAVRGRHPSAKVIACEPELADDAAESFRLREPQPARPPETIADGLRTSVGKLNFDILLRDVDAVVTVSEDAIVNTTKLLLERLKLVVEPSGAVPLAALLEGRLSDHAVEGKRVGIILSGGNVDLPHFFAVASGSRPPDQLTQRISLPS